MLAIGAHGRARGRDAEPAHAPERSAIRVRSARGPVAAERRAGSALAGRAEQRSAVGGSTAVTSDRTPWRAHRRGAHAVRADPASTVSVCAADVPVAARWSARGGMTQMIRTDAAQAVAADSARVSIGT